ncbi:hypothetical protein ACU4GD_33585 [Cupriavidus basilensis]
MLSASSSQAVAARGALGQRRAFARITILPLNGAHALRRFDGVVKRTGWTIPRGLRLKVALSNRAALSNTDTLAARHR